LPTLYKVHRAAMFAIAQLFLLLNSVALTMDQSCGAADEVRMLRNELSSRDSALTLANTELETVRRQLEKLNKKYQTALQKYDTQSAELSLSSVAVLG